VQIQSRGIRPDRKSPPELGLRVSRISVRAVPVCKKLVCSCRAIAHSGDLLCQLSRPPGIRLGEREEELVTRSILRLEGLQCTNCRFEVAKGKFGVAEPQPAPLG